MKKENLTSKWIDEGGIFYQVSGDIKIHQSPGSGVFELYQSNGQDKRIGLKKLYDKFEFPFKIYDVGCDSLIKTIKKTWESNEFTENNRNLGVIFSGTKGTGKSLSAKILCNEIGIPVIIVSDIKEGMVGFLQSLSFEAIILIDEAEKIFKKGEDDEILLKIVDGQYNLGRKLYILTVNRLDVNDNLLGRPGRIRYIKQFGNLGEKAVNDYIDDNLKIPEKKKEILELVDLLEISTIDILKNIIEEVNIHGEISEDSSLNIPKAKYIFDIIKFPMPESEEKINEIKSLFQGITDIEKWLRQRVSNEKDAQDNEDWIYDKYNGWKEKLTTSFSTLWKGTSTNQGEIVEVSEDGFLIIKGNYDNNEYFCKVIRQRSNPSLYRGGLIL